MLLFGGSWVLMCLLIRLTCCALFVADFGRFEVCFLLIFVVLLALFCLLSVVAFDVLKVVVAHLLFTWVLNCNE